MDIEKIFNSFNKKKIAVVGDIMLDRYIFGHVSRISPEYPVPVVDVSHETLRLGGAANVAVNIHAMGAKTILFGIVGNDDNARTLKKLMQNHGVSPEHLFHDPERPTTCKTRILSQNHHIARVDYESRDEATAAAEEFIDRHFKASIDSLDAIVLQDYNKGVLTPSLINKIITLASSCSVPVFVDPKLKGFFNYSGSTVFKPNLSEVASSLSITLQNTDHDIEQACKQLMTKMRCQHLVVTRSEKGLTICNDRFTHIPASSLDVADVSGAGDTVIAILSLSFAAGLDIETSAEIANIAAGTVCQEVGAVPVSPEKLLKACREYFKA
ncbi:D-glycero-beta-D-manno-heptose-7-phosphate kinase [Prosthecochloris sp. SCSIO W1103]|uniref:D-glycero-beta-D-manno-heptose-7-phosphate kinase n=1 Tax=Prosthecochloris sp. SCSIO W1103 TaxID=2992244 RepID=UPI00223E7A33|nr:D-glycero-beta-D-manno-heptose-7-phosphate kinase [Prosthecochloris sp. SCSIO W1103]UZJ38630.1 D-glycero-beta-D-manno-heptose-7-phosphate kinase [Prosthecochloris sp. SCSIO W1103]